MEYFLHIFVLIGIYSILTTSLDLCAGHTGLWSIAHAAYFGIGAYVSALFTLRAGGSLMASVLLATTVTGVAAALTSACLFRLRGDLFSVATFGLQMIVFSILNNWFEVTRGALGLSAIRPLTMSGKAIQGHLLFFAIVLIAASVSYVLVRRLVESPFGRVLHAIREDEVLAQAFGKNTFSFKLFSFSIGASLAGLAGSLYAHYATFIDPTSFTTTESILVLTMVIIGGAGSRGGALVGAITLVLLPEALRFLGLPNAIAANARQCIYGALLVVLMVWRPSGLFGGYGFGKVRDHDNSSM
jgi:branched-chain amino acid transport system permease protein